MEIQFRVERLATLYKFKKQTIQLCLQFIKDVVKNSSQAKTRTLLAKLKEIETDLYDIFCRWNFNSIQKGTFDMDTFLPTDSFIQMVDLAYYTKRFHIDLHDSLIVFPFNEFDALRISSKTNEHESEEHYTKCSQVQKDRLMKMYKGSNLESDSSKILARYYYLGGLNNSLSTPPPILDMFPSHELFGTPINTCSPSYCSPFYDEKVFGSSGSFFEFTDYKEDVVYFANPPFDDPLCTRMSHKLIQDLERGLFSLIIIIPVWDKDQQDLYGLKNFGLPFEAYHTLVKSPYFIQETFLPKNQFPFYNYFYQKYVYISNTHLINLGKPVDIQAIKQSWKSITKSRV